MDQILTLHHKLIHYFHHNKNKPSIFYAVVRRPDNDDDREGLRDLEENGFKVEEWTDLKNKILGIRQRCMYIVVTNI